jgi:hypothetical protein
MKNSLPDYDEVKACVQEFIDEVMNFQDGSVGIEKIGFITDEFIKELEDEELDILEYDADFAILWIDGHCITIEAKYRPIGPDESEVIWTIAE